MPSLAQKQTKVEQIEVKTVERLESLLIANERITARYSVSLIMPDETAVVREDYTVNRPTPSNAEVVAEVDGLKVTLAQFIALGAAFAEAWRAEDIAEKT